MKLIYTHQNPLLVANAKNLLEAAGIGCAINNEYASGGVGELSFVDAWPEVWTLHDNDYQQARAIISKIQSENGSWVCPKCQERNDNSFEICWQCSTPAPSLK